MKDPIGTTTIRFDERNVRRIFITALACVAVFQLLVWAAGKASAFSFELLLAWLLAISLEPAITALTSRGWSRRWAVAATFVGLSAGVISLVVLLGRIFFQQVAEALAGLPQVATSLVDWVNTSFNWKLDAAMFSEQFSFEQLTSVAGNLAGGVLNVVAGASAAFIGLIVILVFAFFMAAEAPTMRRVIAGRLKPAHQQVFLTGWNLTVAKAGGFVLSRAILAGISSLVHGVVFLILGVPYWLPLGLFMGVVSSFLPILGTYIGVAVPVLFALSVQPVLAVWVIVFAIVYQQVENYLVSPRVTRATMDLHPAVSIGAVILGVALFGPLAAFISIPLAAAVIAMVQSYLHRYELIPELRELEEAEDKSTE